MRTEEKSSVYRVAVKKLTVNEITAIRNLDLKCKKSVKDISWYIAHYFNLEEVVFLYCVDELVGYCLLAGVSRNTFKAFSEGSVTNLSTVRSRAYKALDKTRYYVFKIQVLDGLRVSATSELICYALDVVKKNKKLFRVVTAVSKRCVRQALLENNFDYKYSSSSYYVCERKLINLKVI